MTPDPKHNFKDVGSPDSKQTVPRSHMVTRGKALSEAFKASALLNTPETGLYREARTPSTCASSQASPALSEKSESKFEEAPTNSLSEKSSTPSFCKNLSSRFEGLGSPSKNETISESACDTQDEEIYFDFDPLPFFRNNKVDKQFEDLMSLNRIQTDHEAFRGSESTFGGQNLFGDSLLPLSALY